MDSQNSASGDSLPTYSFSGSSNRARRHISPVDKRLYDPDRYNRAHPFRCRFHRNPLFKITKGEGVEDNESSFQNGALARKAEKHRPTKNQKSFTVESCTLECLISVARASAFLAASRLGHRKNFFPHVNSPRDPETVEPYLGKEDPGRLRSWLKEKYLKDNFTCSRCLESCKSATEATIQILQASVPPLMILEALRRYEDDPDILWSLWCHQSVQFVAYSQEVIETLDQWSDTFQGGESTEPNEHANKTEQKHMERARRSYASRTHRQADVGAPGCCTCHRVVFAGQSFFQRMKAALRSQKPCDVCFANGAGPPSSWKLKFAANDLDQISCGDAYEFERDFDREKYKPENMTGI